MVHLSKAISPAEFINVVPINPLVSKCQIKVCYVSDKPNRNGTVITKEVATKMANSLPASPIVGFYKEEKQDFGAHEQELIITEDSVDFKSITVPYGFVDLNAKVWFQWFLDDNQVEREYLVTEGYIWTGRYPEARRMITHGNNQSMELDKESVSGIWTKDANNKPQFFIINEANISALCALGEDEEPCFEGAQIRTEFALSEDFKNTFYQMAQELKDILSEGGNTMNEEMTNVEVVEEVTEEVIVEETVVEEVATEETAEHEVVETPEVEEENSSEIEGQNTETETVENSEIIEGNFSENSEEEVEESESEESEQSEYSLDEIPEYVELSNRYSALEANYNNLMSEVETLRTFKLAADRQEKNALIAKFYMLSEEDKADVINNIDNYSLEEIESRLAVICFRNKVNFSLEEEVQEEALTYNLEASNNEYDDAPDWVKAVRATKESNI